MRKRKNTRKREVKPKQWRPLKSECESAREGARERQRESKLISP